MAKADHQVRLRKPLIRREERPRGPGGENLMAEVEYVLGHSAHEQRRLEMQAELLAPGTNKVMHASGLRPGMSVLDVGSGAGDVAMLAAAIVGPSGVVVGIDKDASVLERARLRANVAGMGQIDYNIASLGEFFTKQLFDLAGR